MKVTEETVDKIAHLARLEVSAEEKQDLMNDMSRILSFMDKLNEVDTSTVEPLVYMTQGNNIFREDLIRQETTHQEALQNAPQQDGTYFMVPKVLVKKAHSEVKS